MRTRSAPLRILCYAVNGLGLGHLTRLVAISRQIRRLTTLLGQPTEILFLTSSEGDALAALHGFATFKVPSKTLAHSCGLDPARYRKIARQWIWNAANLVSPDLLLVDTFPAGSFHELPGVLDLGSRNVFIYRDVRPEIASQPAFQAALPLYDLILRIDEAVAGAGGDPDERVPEPLRDRVERVGPVLLRSVAETWERNAARERLGLPSDGPAVYLSTGGGGDREAEASLRELVRAAALLPEVRFVVGAGLLYRGREWFAPNVTWTRRPVLVECFRAFDAAITAGGFNSVWELMHLGVPCLFLPRARGWDNQEARAERCAGAGAGRVLSSTEPDQVVAALREMLQPEAQSRHAAAASGLLPENQALEAALEVLSVVVERSRLEDASLLVDAELLFRAEQEGIGERDLLQAMALITARSEASWDAGVAEDVAEAALRLLRHVHGHGGATRQALGVLKRTERSEDPETLVEHALRLWDEERLALRISAAGMES